MFDKKEFSHILQKITDIYASISEFSEKSEVNRTYLSKYINMKLDNPPTPKILSKIADAAHGIVSYEDLMVICGYSEYPQFSDNVNFVVQQLTAQKIEKKFTNIDTTFEKLLNLTTDEILLSEILDSFNVYCEDIIKNAYNKDFNKKMVDYININDTTIFKGFKIVYSGLLKNLYSLRTTVKHNNIFLINKNLILQNDKNDILEAISTIKSFNICINVLYDKWVSLSRKEKIYMCPVYGKISAGQPNWAEECLNGYLPIDPNLMGIVNPEECFFLKVDGESMNKVIRNGAYALIRKQDSVEDGEIAVVLVNGFDATLKKFTKQGDFVFLEPMSTDETIKRQIYDKNTPIKIIGKYIGKFEIN